MADFGLARLTREGDAADLTQIGMTMGTPLYMSPEQVEGKPLDCRSDIYSFGVTCYHMLSGHPPFVGETALGVAVQHLRSSPSRWNACARFAAGVVPDRPQDDGQGPGRPLAVAAGILRELRRIQQEYCPENADEDFSLGIEPAAQPAEPRLEATRQLASAMERGATAKAGAAARAAGGRAGPGVRRRRGLRLVRLGRRRSWRRRAANTCGCCGRRRALRQYYCASQLGTEEAWRSVLEYFPEKESVVRRAKQQLARIYLRTRDDARAMAIFEEFAAATDADKEFRAYGLAGKAGRPHAARQVPRVGQRVGRALAHPRRTPR